MSSPHETTANITPWLPEKGFWTENIEPISDILATVEERFPDYAPPAEATFTEEGPSDELRHWMWKRLMGIQHGSQQGFGGKLPVTADKEHLFAESYAQLHYGPYSFTQPHPVNPGAEYDKAYVLGGSPSHNTSRLLAAINNQPNEANVKDVILMAGQRLRWNIPGEATVDDVYDTINRYGFRSDDLREVSPWVRQQEAMAATATDNEWTRPFATEYDLARLTIETVYRGLINWKDYQAIETLDETAPSFEYTENGQTLWTPPREVTLVTYDLIDGRRVHVTNGVPVPRAQGTFPKPTSDSTTREAVELLGVNRGDRLVISSSIPHARAGVDALIRILSLKGHKVAQADIVTADKEHEAELLTGLGEIIATHKADERLRAVLAGQSPDTDKLKSL